MSALLSWFGRFYTVIRGCRKERYSHSMAIMEAFDIDLEFQQSAVEEGGQQNRGEIIVFYIFGL